MRLKKKIINIIKRISLKNVVMGDKTFIAHHAEIMNTTIDNYTSIGRYDKIRDAVIGKYCCLSWNCTIGAVTHPYNTITNSAMTYRKDYDIVQENCFFAQKKTVIENDVWIGCNVVIISGVTIGNGAVIGAGAVVTKNVPAYEIWAGVPAKKIGNRFSEDIIKRINKLQWWNWTTEELKQYVDLFKSNLTSNILDALEYKHQNYIKEDKEREKL